MVCLCLFETKSQFYMFWLKNQNKLRRSRNAMKLFISSLCILIEVFANKPTQI